MLESEMDNFFLFLEILPFMDYKYKIIFLIVDTNSYKFTVFFNSKLYSCV